MKLFGKKEIKKIETDVEDRKVLKRIQINKAIGNEVKSLNTTKNNCKRQKGILLNNLASFSSKTSAKIKELTEEVTKLEKRRSKALTPLTEELARIEDETASMAILANRTEALKKETEAEKEANIELLKELKDNRVKYKTEVEELNSKKRSINKTFDNLLKERELNEIKEKEFGLQYKKKMLELKKREARSKMKEERNEAENNIIEMNKEKIRKETIKLTSKQETLKAAYQEAKKKGLI